jgi:putative ABC transport system permease protein
MGLVALPGMMTGQILGGSSPVVAIKYQVLIMVGIFCSAAVSVFLSVIFSMRGAIDGWGRVL